MSDFHPPARPTPEQQLVLEALPEARKVARMVAKILGVPKSLTLDDCEQEGCRAMLEARPGFDAALDAAERIDDRSDAIDDDADARNELKRQCRAVMFARFMGDLRERLRAEPEDVLLRKRVIEALRIALGGLDPIEMRVLELRYWDGLSWAKVGAELKMNEKRAQRIDERLRERLRRDLRRASVG